ncbi:MAG: peptidylprolyl isomerase [Flavobacteriaceae bacterium]|nr:peptidylprolyl isomerase [Flavobacteriaceae bacterium]
MAVLSKIRERSLFLIIIIALALFSFVLSGLFDGNLFDKVPSEIGEVNGESIGREEFAQQVEFYRSSSNGRGTNNQNVNNAWNSLIREKVYETQLKKSGIVVGEKDIWDALVNQIKTQGSPQFLNEIGLFDEEKLKEYIATIQESAGENEQGKAAWLNWLNYEKRVKNNIEQTTYNALIKAGLSSTLSEGKSHYYFQNTNVDLQYVYVPFSTISDSLITVTDNDIKDYIKKHPKEYTVEESREIQYVSFTIKPSIEDEEEVKNSLGQVINDREEYSSAAKTNVNIVGFKNATNMSEFYSENGSDTPFDNSFYTKNNMPKTSIAIDTLFNAKINDVFGPYKEDGFYKLLKISAVKQLPDSVKASHILIPFVGSTTADASVTQNSEEAKKVADSILTVIKEDKSKFEELAKEISIDKVSGAKGGDLGWFTYKTMIPEFRDYVFENNVNDMEIVKSQFGYHIIRIDGQKNIQKNIQAAIFSRKIEASEKTENMIFEKAETFSSNLSSNKDITALSKENRYVSNTIDIEKFDDNISQLGSQRQIVRWAFEENTEVNDIKRFDIDNGYAVVILNKKNKAGLSAKGKNVRGIILNQKKAELIKEKSIGETLEEIAKQNSTTIRSSLAISNTSPVFAGLGRFTDIAGVVTSLNENILAKNIIGKNGIAFAKVTKKNSPTELNNYNSNKKSLEKELQNRNLQIFNAIKDNSEIIDNRSIFY